MKLLKSVTSLVLKKIKVTAIVYVFYEKRRLKKKVFIMCIEPKLEKICIYHTVTKKNEGVPIRSKSHFRLIYICQNQKNCASRIRTHVPLRTSTHMWTRSSCIETKLWKLIESVRSLVLNKSLL